MPESLTLRYIQLPASNPAPSAPSGTVDDAGAVDFRALLAQQLGAAPAAAQLSEVAETTLEPGSERGDEADATSAELPLAASAALQLTAQSSVVPAEGLSLRRVAPERGHEGDSAEKAVAPARPAAADTASTTATIAAGTDEVMGPRVPAGPERDALHSVSELRPEPAPAPGMERRAEVLAQQAPKGAPPLEQPVSMARHSFSSDLGDRVVWMASNNRQVAQLRVDPPQLGPVEVRLSITGEQASLSLVSANAGVREALQASIPRLQDMIQSIGLELGSVTVGSESFSRQQEQAEHQPGRYWQEQGADSPAALEPVAWPSRAVVGRGLVDVFA